MVGHVGAHTLELTLLGRCSSWSGGPSPEALHACPDPEHPVLCGSFLVFLSQWEQVKA